MKIKFKNAKLSFKPKILMNLLKDSYCKDCKMFEYFHSFWTFDLPYINKLTFIIVTS